MVRKELTISLDEELIDEMVEIAEHRTQTLSSLIRDLVACFCRSHREDAEWTLLGPEGISDLRDGESLQSLPSYEGVEKLHEQVMRHDGLIIELIERVSRLEQIQVSPLTSGGSEILTPAGASVNLLSFGRPGGAVIDTDGVLPSNLSQDALVKIPNTPVLPVIDAIEYGGSKGVREEKEYTLTEAAAILGLSSGTLRKYVKEEKIRGRKVARAWLITGKEILNYLALAEK